MARARDVHIDASDREHAESGPVSPAGGGRLPSRYTGPGLVDLQLNGYAGHDFNGDPAALTAGVLRDVLDRVRRRGVAAALPTFITDDADRLVARAAAYARAMAYDPDLEAAFPGLHVEGPFLSAEDGPRGAHPKAYCRTPHELPDLVDRLREASGDRIRLLTLAPELPGALDLIARVSASGTTVALGHTAASRARLLEAVDAGARLSTHLGNGSHQQLPRLDNYVQAQLADDRLFASFIADGHHMPFYTLKNFLRAKALERSILVTDGIAAADAGPGEYSLAGERVVVTDDLRVHPPGQPHLAGSALTLDRAVINVTRYGGVPFEEAWAMASVRPAELVGLPVPRDVTVEVEKIGFRATDSQ